MSLFWFAVATAGLAAFTVGLVLAAWRGHRADGRWRPGGWRFVVLAVLGWTLFALGLRLTGTERIGIEYPPAVGGS